VIYLVSVGAKDDLKKKFPGRVFYIVLFSVGSFPVCAESSQLWGVLHSIHTTASDGFMKPEQRDSTLNSYYGWASTIDHVYELSNSEWAAAENEANSNNVNGSFTYFPGYEMNSVTGPDRLLLLIEDIRKPIDYWIKKSNTN
jgi:hypothetical protein